MRVSSEHDFSEAKKLSDEKALKDSRSLLLPGHVFPLRQGYRLGNFAPILYIPSRLIKVQDFWSGNELTSNRKPSFLTAGYALADGCANNGVSLILQPERG